MHLNILFTSVGRRAELVRAFRRAYRDLGLDGKIVALDADPLAPGLQLVDRPYIVPRLDHPDYLSCLLEIIEREAVDLIFPLIDPDITFLARARETIEARGVRIAVVSPEAARLTTDKWLTSHFFCRIGVHTPETWLPEQLKLSLLRYPLFLKPRSGSAGKHTHKIINSRALEFYLEEVPEPLVQEYLPGPEITNDVICDLDGDVLGVVSRQRMEVRS